MNYKLEKYSGTDPHHRVDDFIEDFKSYIRSTNAPWETSLKQHLKGDAKEWYRSFILPTNLIPGVHIVNGQYTEEAKTMILDGLQDQFGMNDLQKHSAKRALFQCRQDAGETFLEFVARIRKKARALKMLESDTVAICVDGACDKIRPFSKASKINLNGRIDEGTLSYG